MLYLACLLVLPWLDLDGRQARKPLGRIVRLCWVVGYVIYLVHVALAFHYVHNWSHAEAMRHIEERSGFGPGIAFSHLFTLLWGADVVWWCGWPASYGRRSRWFDGVLHGYMLFMAFEATVVYETGTIRVAGIVGAVLIGSSFALSCRRRHSPGDEK